LCNFEERALSWLSRIYPRGCALQDLVHAPQGRHRASSLALVDRTSRQETLIRTCRRNQYLTDPSRCRVAQNWSLSTQYQKPIGSCTPRKPHTVDMHSQHGGQSRDDDVDDMCVRWLVVGRVVVIGQSRIVSLGDLSPLISQGSSPRRPAAVYRHATDVHPSFDMSTRCVIDRSGSSDTILWRDTTMIVSLWLSILSPVMPDLLKQWAE
jgi:hypothetical protein